MCSGVRNIWYIYATVFHVLLLGSIFVIYFRSPVIEGLKPQQFLHREAPAKRLVLIIADGLRAQSFFYENLANVPNLRQLIKEQQGLLGISHTRVPTESRPGHIALIAGFYEDPSAVTRGWKENPVEFDTIFQHARRTYAWGSHDILRIFNKSSQRDVEGRLTFDAYNHELNFWGKVKSYELDNWVFSRVEDFLKRERKILQKVDKVYFFLHLLGLDTAGHIHKPQTALYLENLFITEAGICKIYRLFEQIFQDHKTAYIFTSDHGMTDSGSHGAAQPHETETPFYMWGAGINSRPYNTAKYIKLDYNTAMPLYEIEQAQMAPLMSALLGLPPPVNNLGILPRYFLNASEEYIARAAECNAYQLLEQYTHLLKKHKDGILSFLLPEYEALSWPSINEMKLHLKQAHFVEDYQTFTNISYNLMEMTLEGIGYYQSYYSMPLLLATTVAMLSWLKKLISLGFLLHAALSENNGKTTTWKFYIKTIMILVLAVFPLLTPSVGYTDNRLFLLGFLFTISRSILVKCKLTLADKLAAGIALLNSIFCVHNHVNNQELPGNNRSEERLTFLSMCTSIFVMTVIWYESTTINSDTVIIFSIDFPRVENKLDNHIRLVKHSKPRKLSRYFKSLRVARATGFLGMNRKYVLSKKVACARLLFCISQSIQKHNTSSFIHFYELKVIAQTLREMYKRVCIRSPVDAFRTHKRRSMRILTYMELEHTHLFFICLQNIECDKTDSFKLQFLKLHSFATDYFIRNHEFKNLDPLLDLGTSFDYKLGFSLHIEEPMIGLPSTLLNTDVPFVTWGYV
ncbi:hypothetical protein GQX74_011260 [Glossina fuscipes]|nr:hypothetical protein GQX74_011260 [Glossina fuscipes]